MEEDKLDEEIEAVDQVQEKIELTSMHIEMGTKWQKITPAQVTYTMMWKNLS